MIEVYFWKVYKYILIGYRCREGEQLDIPDKINFKNDYKKLPIKISDNLSLGDIFDLFNSDNNPLVSPANQRWIGKNLQPHPHTSMSVGDIVKKGSKYFIAMPTGWKEVKMDKDGSFI